ncbi:type I polyketide synthase [Streptomyces luteogriseus]|uniref:Acyl transferase domain-containing protein n=1 Tax=Streptomyces luteogriseus TaxID=68233 RepID=A0A7W7GL99_9ACTN|nr:type I polyketide synthase [Streptomyces luteogriseus]MBB4716763.1 acyl transferase domain-containing protein [Streptomyces luteogriseus]
MTDQQFDEYAESLDIAVIGMEGRFPQAPDVDAFWRNIRDGKCAVTFLSEDELLSRGVDPRTARDPLYVPAANELADIDSFDAEFFGYSPREAELMDPQHRLLLECAWGALEKAGHDPARYDGLVGVYAGAGTNTYLMFNVAANRRAADMLGGSQVMIGNSGDFLASRVSYKLGLEGPSVNVQSACSTSLVSVVLACQALLSFQCDMALAGGVAADDSKHKGYLYAEDGIFSPDGYCRSFDADARGTVGGNGVGMVVLKRLGDALADGDHIHAVIKGAALNNDGDRRIGFTAPSADSQASVITTALANADVEPETVGYVETHGTATSLGDPIEFAALTAAFGAGTDQRNFCALGAVKTNIGHLDAASGIAGLIKAVSAVEHGQIPPTLHFKRPNPRIDLADSPFFVNTELVPWPVTDGPRRAGVSSFGLGGTNAHVVLEQAPDRPPAPDLAGEEQLIVLSARSDTALEAMSDRLADHLREHPETPLGDLAFTLQTGRRPFHHRRVLVASGPAEALDALDARDDGRVLSAARTGDGHRPVAFMFSGFGEQYPMMTERLYATEPAFREALDECALILDPLLGRDIREVVFDRAAARRSEGDGKPDLRRMLMAPRISDHPLDQPTLGYPAVFAVEYALARLWRAWGVVPEAMIGHSLGEYVAACLAGVFSLPDALRLVVERARLISACGEGAMVAVPLTEEEVARHLTDEVSVAAVNDPRTCVLAGPPEAIDRVTAALETAGVVSRRLNTRFAFHSPMMDPVVAPYAEAVRRVRLSPPAIPFVSNITGTWITAEEATDPDYWARHVRLPVRFADGMRTLWGVDDVVLVEVGPGRALTSGAMQHPASAEVADRVVVPSLPDAFTAESDRAAALRALGRLWLAGVTPDWAGLHAHTPRRRVVLPSYPFARTRYWLDADRRDRHPAASGERAGMDDWFYDTSWQRAAPVEDTTLAADGHRWLVFADDGGLGGDVAARLAALGAPVVTVSTGPAWQEDGPGRYVMNPADPDHYGRLAESLRGQGAFPDRVVHCWAVDPGPTTDDRAAAEETLERGFHSLVRWARACEPELMVGEQHWTVLSSETYSVLGDEPVNPAKATVQGVCKVAPQEYPSLRCAQIDVPVPTGTTGLADRVLAELADEADSGIVALRGTTRWRQVLVPAPLTARTEGVLRPGGVYLITGGLGKIGLVLARAIATRAPGAHLVLMGRTGLPDRGAWDGEHDPATAAAVAAVRELEAMGATVVISATDVADPDAVAAAVDKAVQECGPVNGVIHAAGTTGPAAHQVLADLTDDDCARHFGPKLHGVHVLDRALEGQPLDFAVLCSSVAALLGGLGFTAYAAANAFLDSFARREPRPGRPRWTSLNWEAWHFPGDAGAEAGIGAAVHQVALDPDEGRAVFERLLDAAARPQVIASTTDLNERVRQWSAPVRDTTVVEQRHARPSLRNPYVAPATDLERRLAAIWEELLGIEAVGVQDNFFELGGSSLLGLQVVHRLRSGLGIAVPLTVVYEGPTVRSLAGLIGDLA